MYIGFFLGRHVCAYIADTFSSYNLQKFIEQYLYSLNTRKLATNCSMDIMSVLVIKQDIWFT